MEKVYRYRMVFDERYSVIPCGEWIYVNYNKFCEIKDSIRRGNKYELQAFCLTYHKLPNKDQLVSKRSEDKVFNHLPPEYEKARKLLKILREADILDGNFKCEYLGELEYLQLWDTLIKMAKVGE